MYHCSNSNKNWYYYIVLIPYKFEVFDKSKPLNNFAMLPPNEIDQCKTNFNSAVVLHAIESCLHVLHVFCMFLDARCF